MDQNTQNQDSSQSDTALLYQSSTIPRAIEVSFRERLGIDDMSSSIATLTASVAAVVSVPTGLIAPFGASPGGGWFACKGGTLSRTGSGAALFALIGTTFGVGDGSTSFNVPDLQGRVPVGAGASGVTSIGTTGGEQTHTITESEIPTNVATFDNVSGGGLTGITNPGYGINRASGSAHNNMQPYVGFDFYIKL